MMTSQTRQQRARVCDIWPDYAQGSRAKCGASVREGHLGCPFLLGAPVCHPSPRIRVSTVCAEAGTEAISSGFEPAKAVVGATATSTAILPRPFRMPTSLMAYQGS